MATLKCKICEYGIHYNSEPSGIEYIFIKNEDWKEICDSKFDPNNKVCSYVIIDHEEIK